MDKNGLFVLQAETDKILRTVPLDYRPDQKAGNLEKANSVISNKKWLNFV